MKRRRTIFSERDAEVFELFGEALAGCVRINLSHVTGVVVRIPMFGFES